MEQPNNDTSYHYLGNFNLIVDYACRDWLVLIIDSRLDKNMPDDQNTTQNPIPEENSIPPSPQEPTEPALENTAHSEPSIALPEAPEAPGDDFPVKSNDIPPSDSIPPEPEKELENKAQNEPLPEPQPMADHPPAEIQPPETAPEPSTESESIQVDKETAQIPVNEPLSEMEKPEIEPQEPEAQPQEEIKKEPKQETSKTEPEPEISETKSETKTPEPAPKSPKEEKPKEETKKELEPEKEEKPLDEARDKPKLSYLKSQKLGELLVMARSAIQFRKKKKLEKVMTLFLKKSKITNDEVEKLLHVSDATATRYLSELEKEGKVKQNGKTGKGVSYSRI